MQFLRAPVATVESAEERAREDGADHGERQLLYGNVLPHVSARRGVSQRGDDEVARAQHGIPHRPGALGWQRLPELLRQHELGDAGVVGGQPRARDQELPQPVEGREEVCK
jgi:hypothetical protein